MVVSPVVAAVILGLGAGCTGSESDPADPSEPPVEHGRTLSNEIGRTVTLDAAGECGCVWTPWLDRDDPSGYSDYEALSSHLAEGKACVNPLKVECETLGGVDWTQTGEVYACTPSGGGVCANAGQPDGQCLDYRVRFCCPL